VVAAPLVLVPPDIIHIQTLTMSGTMGGFGKFRWHLTFARILMIGSEDVMRFGQKGGLFTRDRIAISEGRQYRGSSNSFSKAKDFIHAIPPSETIGRLDSGRRGEICVLLVFIPSER
jgi:hypothetical protein